MLNAKKSKVEILLIGKSKQDVIKLLDDTEQLVIRNRDYNRDVKNVTWTRMGSQLIVEYMETVSKVKKVEVYRAMELYDAERYVKTNAFDFYQLGGWSFAEKTFDNYKRIVEYFNGYVKEYK